jgi:predicted nucleic acid-binding protein
MRISRAIFIDSWGFLALANREDRHHQMAVRCYEALLAEGYLLVTSDYILDEVITVLFKKVNFESAQRFMEAVFLDIKAGHIALERVDDDRFNNAWLLRSLFRDKPEISFTDLTSFVAMRDLDITRAFTGDHHFEKVNLGFEIWPDLSE